MKPDERSLLLALAEADIIGGRPKDVFPRDLAVRLGIPAKRACYLFEKWTDKGWYNYGVSVDMGWLEEKGWPALLARLAAEAGTQEEQT